MCTNFDEHKRISHLTNKMHMRKLLLTALAAATVPFSAMAQTSMPDPDLDAAMMVGPEQTAAPAEPWYKKVNLNGFAMIGLQNVHQDEKNKCSFDISMARLAVSGPVDAKKAGLFNWKLQMQVNGNISSLGSSARLVDAYVDWQKFEWLKITMGEFSMPFTLENACHPLDVGFADNAIPILKLSGYSDRSGVRSSNGRDIGICFEGDAIHAADGHAWLHYALAFMNGQGINTRDLSNFKNTIFQVWLQPLRGFRVSFSALSGDVVRDGKWVEYPQGYYGGGITQSGTRQLDQKRYAVGAEWDREPLTLRAEYIHNTGYAFAVRDDGSTDDCNLSPYGNKADGFYAMALVRIFRQTLPGRMRVKARYDMYRPAASTLDAQSTLQLGADYWFTPVVGLAFEYSHANDRSLSRHNYNYIDFQVQFRF